MKRPLIAVVFSAWSLLAAGQNDPTPIAERIAKERTEIETTRREQNAVFAKQESACDGKFAVTSCLREVTVRRRVVMNALKRRESDVDAAQRQVRSIEQSQRSAEKAVEQANRRADREAQTQSTTPADRQAAQDVKVRNHPKPIGTGDRPGTTKATSVIPANELVQNREAYANKQKAALQKQVERDKRLKERGAAPLGLPIPD